MKQSSTRKWTAIVSVSTVALTMLAAVVAARGLDNSISELEVELAKTQADAILARVDIQNDTAVAVPILYYDQVMDECTNMYNLQGQVAMRSRQFEWKSCGYYRSEIETGLVETELGADYLPVAVGGNGTPNRGMRGDNFKRWFNVVEGQSKNYASTLRLVYNAEWAEFSYFSEEFYPLDEIVVTDESVNIDGKNHLFTLNFGVPFRVLANGEEEFEITADDDTFVFVGSRLAIDMGGIHDAVTGRLKIDAEGKIYSSVGEGDLKYTGLRVSEGEDTIVRVFHADRNSESSVFGMSFKNMVLNVTSATLAKGEGGVEVAYDPDNPSYVAPLGESLVVEPNTRRSLVVAIATQATAVGMFSILALVAISVAWRYSRRDHNQAK